MTAFMEMSLEEWSSTHLDRQLGLQLCASISALRTSLPHRAGAFPPAGPVLSAFVFSGNLLLCPCCAGAHMLSLLRLSLHLQLWELPAAWDCGVAARSHHGL